MKRKLKIIVIMFLLSIGSISFVDNYFEISKHIDIFTSLYKELNLFYVDDTDPADLMNVGIDAMLKSLDPYTSTHQM